MSEHVQPTSDSAQYTVCAALLATLACVQAMANDVKFGKLHSRCSRLVFGQAYQTVVVSTRD